MKLLNYICPIILVMLIPSVFKGAVGLDPQANDNFEILKTTRKLVFLGDSITWGGEYIVFFERWLTVNHIGDLSAVVCTGHPETKKTNKYKKWAKLLFTDYPSASPRLRKPVYFWLTAWKKDEIGIWEEFGPTSLTFLEYQLIGVASRLSKRLLNDEGVNRD